MRRVSPKTGKAVARPITGSQGHVVLRKAPVGALSHGAAGRAVGDGAQLEMATSGSRDVTRVAEGCEQ